MTCRAGHNTDLPLNSNISKMVRVNITFTRTFCEEYSVSFLMISKLMDFALAVFIFSGTESVSR